MSIIRGLRGKRFARKEISLADQLMLRIGGTELCQDLCQDISQPYALLLRSRQPFLYHQSLILSQAIAGVIGCPFTAMSRHRLSRASVPLLAGSRTYIAQNTIQPWRSRRTYSIQSQEEALARLPDIDPNKLSIIKTTTPKQVVPPEQLIFGRNFTGKLSSSHSSRVIRHSI